ncbi:DUF2975 domain-containing protein [Microbacterium dauci]|uniref:DUF2975 domain-containing protein n=1 Tax=Microbacterium dauci TaxID=3048008 RepID=A0ABT6ZC30_9MICO|nr:DUF2975 domain-containing protein [Microbacterium sp. LX3-4]MDJ1113703.1 DUF2975 domain-containing protein [Microbacterium sp. LX3-4]
MPRPAITALRFVIALSLVGSVLVQTVLMTAIWFDLEAVPLGLRITVIAIFEAWVICLQVVAVCIWRLAGLAASGAVFTTVAFRSVDIVIGAIGVAGVLTAALATLMVGGAAAPGLVGLVYGAALVTGGVALVVVVMRMLLRQAADMRAELAEVV